MSAYDESSLSVDNFKNPKVFQNAEALMLLLSRLILLEPGTFQSHPDMGVGLLTNFRYKIDSEEGLESSLKNRIRSQIDTYLPILTGVDIQVKLVDHTFYVTLQLNGQLFSILYDSQNNAIQTKYATIEDL